MGLRRARQTEAAPAAMRRTASFVEVGTGDCDGDEVRDAEERSDEGVGVEWGRGARQRSSVKMFCGWAVMAVM